MTQPRSPLAPRVTLLSERAATLRGVDIFAAGRHRGKDYTTADLDAMVRNFRAASAPTGPDGKERQPRLRVPAVLGHEETQEYLERSDLPAAAWATHLYRVGGKLKADFADVPPAVARLLKGRRYRTVSAEIYDRPPEGVGGSGKMLRRVAFLGGEIPQVKTLDDIPLPEEHAETRAAWRRAALIIRAGKSNPARGTYTAFAEVSDMDRAQMIEQLGALGLDTSVLTDAVPDEVLAEMLRVAETLGTEPDEDDTVELAEPADEDEKQALAAKAQKMMARAKKWAEKYCGKMADQPMPEPKAEPAQPATGFGGAPKKVTMTQHYAERLKAIEERTAKAAKMAEDRLSAEVKATIKTRLDQLVKDGKVLPAERDAGLDEVLADLDAITVHKFADGKKQTALERQLAILEARPPLVKFGERVKGTHTRSGPDAELARVERFAESAPFREALEATGQTPEHYVAEFKAARAKSPHLTAAAFGVPEELV